MLSPCERSKTGPPRRSCFPTAPANPSRRATEAGQAPVGTYLPSPTAPKAA